MTTEITHNEIQKSGYFWVASKEVTNQYGQYDGDMMTAFNPETNSVLHKHSRVGLPNTMIGDTPDSVIQDWEGYL
jgi:hypothetical protein